MAKFNNFTLILYDVSLSRFFKLYASAFTSGIHEMKKWPMIKKKLAGNIFMEMYLDILHTNLFFVLYLEVALSYLLCKYYTSFKILNNNNDFQVDSEYFSLNELISVQCHFHFYAGSSWCFLPI